MKKILGYKFRNPKLLDLALTTPAFAKQSVRKSKEHYEDLEKVGDALIGLLSIEKGYKKNKWSGKLHTYREIHVNNQLLAQVFDDANLFPYVQWSKGQHGDDQWEKSKELRGDIFEAVIGAIYLDGGYEKAKKIFWKFVKEK